MCAELKFFHFPLFVCAPPERTHDMEMVCPSIKKSKRSVTLWTHKRKKGVWVHKRRKLIMSQGEKKVFNVSFFPWLGQNFYPALLPPLHFLPYHLSFLYFLKKNKSLCRLRKWAPKVFCVPSSAAGAALELYFHTTLQRAKQKVPRAILRRVDSLC